MKLTILVSGMVAGVPHHGGATWAVLQYVLGFKRLGHDVYFVEPITADALLPTGTSLPDSENAAYFRQVVRDFEFEEFAALLLADTQQTVGIPYDALVVLARHVDVLINLSGLLADENLLQHIPRRVYVDLDPAFSQFWHFRQGIDLRFDGHTHRATVGLSIGQPDCPIPTGGLEWITTLPPVVLEQWPFGQAITCDAFTTVANWRGYGSIELDGVQYGQKAHSLRKLIDLPTRTAERFALALAIHPNEASDLEALGRNGWQLLDPRCVAGSPHDYRRFVAGSKAELGVAKSGYVVSKSGWFSDRSVGYLASGRPVIAQETGFSRWLPVGEGLLPFETTGDALAAIDQLRGDYGRHTRAARELAEAHFDSDRVLARLLDRVGSTG